MTKILSFQEFLTEREQILNEGIVNPVFVGDNKVEQIDKMIKQGKSKDKIVDELVNFVTDNERFFERVKKKFESMMGTAVRKYNKVKVLSDIKELDSITDKAVDRGKSIVDMNDLVRGAVLFDNKKQADEFVKKFVKKNKQSIVEYEEKERGEDKKYGYYGSHHMLINIEGLLVEIQVMTRKLWSYKKAAHEIYKKTRSQEGGMDRFQRHQSNMFFSMGNKESGDDVDIMFTIDEMENMSDTWEEVDLTPYMET